MTDKTVRLIADPKVVQFLFTSKDLFSQLPYWKRGVLETSSQSFNSEPRQPIVNFNTGVDK
jgi:hypothetical protein